ncbi:hypothetical protein [Pseudomonas moraviensis]|uniref:hypothetical protein n=1 Tax=Pseudomonas moraviensis TaxID=321662 RepID=UPI0020925586|nr:hypothetical protein [Pseudomonas moraviensis]UST60772.1 hypothetical protein NF672_09600 [Pseudomonas moraviensis]UST71160.1 hypothetical protein NF674_09550 [Pseudomonas moraviensis]
MNYGKISSDLSRTSREIHESTRGTGESLDEKFKARRAYQNAFEKAGFDTKPSQEMTEQDFPLDQPVSFDKLERAARIIKDGDQAIRDGYPFLDTYELSNG